MYVQDDEERLTPTCVGRTGGSRRSGRPESAHPHVRGEDLTVGGGGRRLTPTCVGRTGSTTVRPIMRAAHPHVRGEDSRG